MSVRYDLDYSQLTELEQKIARLPNKMEEVINRTLHFKGVQMVKEEITNLLPVSSRRNRRVPRAHARDSEWATSERHNLAITAKTKGGAANKPGSFGYLVFPNEGRGPQNLVEQRFMERGLEVAVPKIMNLLHQNIDRTLEEEL